MQCNRPLKGYRSSEVNPTTGKRSIVFGEHLAASGDAVTLPCGRCISCRLERSRQWAIRCVHEASLYKQNMFLTLTYDPKHLPKGGTLVKRHVQLFMKRFRKKVHPQKIRYFYCGEYGEKNDRPHYHILIFGYAFNDMEFSYESKRGDKLYTSNTLDDLWGYGLCNIGELTFESAAYVARYVTKKITGDRALDHYNDIDYETGEILNERIPEFVDMSRGTKDGPKGIGSEWLKKYTNDVYPKDFINLRGKKMKPPKYYDRHMEKLGNTTIDLIRELRKEKFSEAPDNAETRKRNMDIEYATTLSMLKRNLGK